MDITNFTPDQLAVALIAGEVARLISLQQWMSREDAAKAEDNIKELRKQQLIIETRIEWDSN